MKKSYVFILTGSVGSPQIIIGGGGEHYTNPSIKILLKARRLCKGLWVDGLCAFPAAYLGRGLILPEVSRAH